MFWHTFLSYGFSIWYAGMGEWVQKLVIHPISRVVRRKNVFFAS